MNDTTRPSSLDDERRVDDPLPLAAAPAGVAARDPIRVLFVDDDPDVIELLTFGMRHEHFEIRSANSADEALRVLAETEIDVVVSDEQMPGTSGCKFLALVRRQWPRTMRVMLSGCADMRATLGAINEAHVFRFLTKPCHARDVAFCIRQAAAVKERATRRALAEPGASSRPSDAEFARFRGALERLSMVYQPIVRACDSQLFAYEALVRCRDPELAHPIDLIACAERLGTVETLDRTIRALVADDMERIEKPTRVLVNLHPRSLQDESLYSESDALRPHSERVIIEITEREGLSTVADLPARVTRLRRCGYRLAVDDLGAGYAGLTTFAQLVPEVVKFDMELIRGIDRSTTKAKLVQSMATLCREMNIQTIAEGIETAEERRCVTSLGCDLLQGFEVGRPERLDR
jgi:EAL domain-containing protein (putative c-di-GMP-specific phosphodiesterase class I)